MTGAWLPGTQSWGNSAKTCAAYRANATVSADFAITNGVLSTQNVRIEGALFSILAEGTYDIVRDNLDFSVRVRFMKDDSFLGRFLIRPITWTFSKLLLEFKVTGSLDDPKWEYISVIDRIL